ncbi:NHL domain-containing protein isoform X2 [Tasmannia lanceolata]
MPFGCDHILMLERVKLLQQRYPKLNIFGFQPCNSLSSVATQAHITQTIMKEYITFPILLSNKNFTEMINGTCYLFCEGFGRPLLYHMKDVDFGMIVKEIEELKVSQNANAVMAQTSKSTEMRQSEVIKEPLVCSSFRNLLLYFPGCISVDEDGNRLFLSDTNHHRILITDSDGKMLDCIGSSPGFEDGGFDSAKLLRPAASFYHVAEDCLYFVDSENHAIRRADLETRMLETVYPICDSHLKNNSIWNWILDKLGMRKDADPKPDESAVDSFNFPWHLMKSGENDFLIINRSFETLWIMSQATGEIKDVVKGSPNIMELCGDIIMEKISLLEGVIGKCLQQRVDSSCSLTGLPYTGLVSSLATFHNNLVFCDTAGQRVLKCQRGSKDISNLQMSNLGILGLPYWLSCPLERVFVHGDLYERPRNDHLQYFNVLPGRCDIRMHVNVPEGTELAAQLEEGCIWRQARGSAVEISAYEAVAKASEKVGVAQQWFDELDNLAFSKPGMESTVQDAEKIPDRNSQEKNLTHIDCAVNISPGTSEVAIYAVLYLKVNEIQSSPSDHQNTNAVEKILDISNHDRRRKQGGDACIQLMLESCKDLGDIVFMKPFHVRIRLECGDHPKAANSKDIISTDTTIQVNVSLD